MRLQPALQVQGACAKAMAFYAAPFNGVTEPFDLEQISHVRKAVKKREVEAKSRRVVTTHGSISEPLRCRTRVWRGRG